MVNLEVIREEMKKRFAIDNELHMVDVHADTIDEALEDAAVQLDTKVSYLHYEIIEKGSEGFLGLGKKPWKLKVYQNPDSLKKSVKLASEGLIIDDDPQDNVEVKNQDGLFFVRHFGNEILLKVLLPLGAGEPVELKEVLDELNRADTIEIDESLVKKYIKQGTDGLYNPVGVYKHVAAGDALVTVDCTKDDMKASIIVSPPSMSGAEASADLIKRSLISQGVIEQCFIEDRINEFVDRPVYNTPFEVATAILPVDGKDSYLTYHFETDTKKLKAKVSESGNINYKELNQIQNVIRGQPLATKIHAERGKGGKTIFGRYIEAKNGKEIPIQLGNNVELDRDGVTIKASIEGEAMLVNGRITVEPIKILDAVNVKTGDIKFVGTVIIKGSVEDGYRVEATNIEVHGIVDRSYLEATGNIIVQQGVFGKGEGYIKAGKSLWAKFINDTTVEVEENVIVSDSIVNSNVTAMKNILLKGKKAQIIGGHLLATEEICARKVGSPGGGTETILEVGIDPRAKKRLNDLQKKLTDMTRENESNLLDIQNLDQQKRLRKRLPQEKEDKLATLKQRNKLLSSEIHDVTDEIEKIQAHLRELKAVGKVKVEGVVYAGVKIYVRDVLDEVKIDVTKGLTFLYDKGFPKRADYEPPSFKIEEPDGYTE